MRKRKIKKWLFFLLLLLIVGAIFVFFSTWLQREKEKKAAELNADTEVLDEMDYSAADKIEAAMKKLEENPEQAQVITDINTVDRKVALCFEGTTDSLIIQQIVEYLGEYDMHAAFFIPAVDASEDEEMVNSILEAGHDMESYTLYGTSHMEEFTQEELVEDFCRAQAVYEGKIGISPSILKCNATDYTEEITEAADACGYDSVLHPTHYLNYASFSSEKMAQNYVKSVGRGSIIMVKLSGYLDELEYEETKVDEDPAKDKQPGVELHDTEVEEELSDNDRLLQVVKWLLKALDDADYETVPLNTFPAGDMGDLVLKYEGLEEQYEEEKAETITAVHTTDRETAFTFRGLGDEAELQNLLAVLQEIEATATFFVTGEEIEQYPQQIQMILDAGCEIGNGGYLGKSMKDMSFGEICEDIYKNDIVLESVGVQTELFMPPYGVVTDEVQTAAAAMDKQLVLYNSSPARTEYAEENDTAEEVVKKYFSDARLVLCRGDITYFNMDVYDDSTSIADLVKAVYQMKVLPTDYGFQEGHILQICTMSQLLDNTWQYPAATNATYYQIGASGKMLRPLDQMMSTGYIGNPYLGLSGFSEGELSLLDMTGRVNTGGTNTVFLTFDDWGNEATIGKVLYVLRKHHVKATFFIKAEYVVDGSTENLLRAIAEEGHDVASHTNSHMTIDVTPDQVETLQKDLVAANQTLAKVVGNTGRLTSYFRPPTLAVNKTGLSTVYDAGYSWVINADVSTGDYKLSVDELYDVLLNGSILDDGSRVPIQDGSVVVMHINTNATNTARAVDRYLNHIEELPDGDPNKFNFARLSDYLH